MQLVLVLVVGGAAGQLVFRPDLRDDMRRGDTLLLRGQYYEALLIYQSVARQGANPRALVRRGMIETVRGEAIRASRTFAIALNMGLAGPDYELARLYQGRASALNGQRDEAFGFWRTIAPGTPLYPYRRVLEAETLLDAGEYGAAEATYREALATNLSPAWRRLAQSRIAALRATSDPEAARAELRQIANLAPAEADFITPLLPAPAPAPERLATALAAPTAEQPTQLGQLYLEAGLYALAEAQFAAVSGQSPEALSAQAYAAYARLRSGDRAGGLARLEALVQANPEHARARALLALAYLDRTAPEQAKAQLDTIRALAPKSPDTHLAWGQWYAAQHDYIAAANEYRRALSEAPVEQRSTYLLALARFHLDTTVRACEDGRPAAEEAARLLDDAEAWTLLAHARLVCRDAAPARDAAEIALQRAPGNAEAAFYRGQALVLLGERQQARAALVAAADLAPASDWRVKAENQIKAFGL